MDADEGETARKWRLQSPIRLGEAVALLGVIIAGLGLYVSNTDRQKDRQEAALQAQQRAQIKSVLVLRGEGGGGRIRLIPANPDQVVQSQIFYFPRAVRANPVRVTGDGRLDAGWLADGLKKALHGSADNGSDQNILIGVSTTFVEDGDVKADSALYDLAFTIHPRMLQSAEVRLEGIALERRASANGLQASVDNAWISKAPPKP